MAINFPGSLDNFTNPTSASPINSPSHADQHSNANDAIEALEAKVGSNNSVVTTSHDYKIAQLESLVTSSVAGAKSIYQDVRNQSGSAFTKATPVYVSGSEGTSGKMLISAASNASEATSSKTMGITTSAISNNSNGQVISEGILEGIDTTGAADGDPVWLGVNGAKIYGLVSKPSAPAHLVFLGIVIRGGQANTGSMYVKIQNGFELQEIHNVELSSLVNGNVLAYDSSTSTWKNTNTLQSTSSTVPLVIKRVTSQTSNLQEWQDQSGGMLAFFNKDGALTFNSSSAIGGTLNVFTSYAGNTGVIIRGFTSQTANLQEWQNSSGTVLARITSTGTISGTNGLSATGGSITGVNSQANSIGSAISGVNWAVTAGGTTLVPIVARGAASQTANLQEWQNSSGTVLASVIAGGSIRGFAGLYGANSANSSVNPLFVVNSVAANVVAVIKGAASQTANLTEWQDSSGTLLSYVTSVGSLRAPFLADTAGTGAFIQMNAGNAVLVNTRTASIVGLIVRGQTSQTADLQQWQNVGGTVLANVGADGTIYSSAINTWLGYNRAADGVATYNFTTVAAANYAQASISRGSGFNGNLEINQYGSGAVVIQNGSAAGIGLIVKGYASQTADLQQWQDSSGNIQAKITKDGVIVSGTSSSPASGIQIGSASFTGVSWNGISNPAGTTTLPSLVVKGITSQTANLQEWQNSAGTVLAKVDANGSGTFTGSASTNAISAYAGASGNYVFKGFNQSNNLTSIIYQSGEIYSASNLYVHGAANYGAAINVKPGSTSTTGMVIRGLASQTANLQEWQDSAGTVLVSIGSNGFGLFGANVQVNGDLRAGASNLARITSISDSTTKIGLVVRGAASQTANLQEWQDSAGTVLANIWASGTFATAGRIAVGNGSTGAKLDVMPASTTQVGVTIKANASQTANLQEWQSDTGTVLSKVTSSGRMDVSGLTVIGNAYASGVVLALFVGTGTSQVPLASRGSSTQTANLQEWQNSSGTVLTSVNKDGHLHTPRLVIANGGNIVDSAGTTPYFGFGSNQIAIYTRNAAYKGLVIQGSASQTANLQEWQDSSGTVLARIDANGQGALKSTTLTASSSGGSALTLVAASGQTAPLLSAPGGTQINSSGNYLITPGLTVNYVSNFHAGASNVTPIYIRGAASQTANLQEWQNSSGTVLVKVAADGRVTFPGANADIHASGNLTVRGSDAWSANASALIGTGYAGGIGLIVKAVASQTANLQEWQDSSGTVQAYIGANGFINTNNSLRVAGDNLSAYRFQGVSDGNYTMNFPGSGNIQLFSATNDTGSGVGVLGIKNATTAPTSNPTTGGILYVSSGALLYRGTSNSSQQIIGADGSVKFTSPTASIPALIIQGAASPSANLQEWKNSSGTIMARITSSYIFEVYNGVYSYQLGSSNDGSLVANMGANGSITFAGTVSIPTIKSSASSTISVNTATTVDTVALSSFTTIEYTLSIKQGSKIRSSKVLIHTDGISVDSTEYGIMEMGGGITGILVTASVSSTNAILQVTITDAATTNATVKLIKTML